MSSPPLKYRGRLKALAPEARRRLLDRTGESDTRVAQRTAELIARVRRDGDKALREMARELDRVELQSLEVPRSVCEAALASLEPKLKEALSRAARNIAKAHAAQRPQATEVETEPGILVGRRPDPLGRVGVYAPGGRAVYPSSVLMGVVPAKVAGVGEVIVCSPPGLDGRPSAGVLADAVAAAVGQAAASAKRQEIVTRALSERGAVLSVDSLEEAWPFVADFAPEHLLIATMSPLEDLPKARNAGTVFVGQYASVAYGDYMTGANHVLPTAGLARAYSGLSVLDFYRWTTYQRVTRDAAERLAEDVGLLADSEGLFAHADAARGWRKS